MSTNSLSTSKNSIQLKSRDFTKSILPISNERLCKPGPLAFIQLIQAICASTKKGSSISWERGDVSVLLLDQVHPCFKGVFFKYHTT